MGWASLKDRSRLMVWREAVELARFLSIDASRWLGASSEPLGCILITCCVLNNLTSEVGWQFTDPGHPMSYSTDSLPAFAIVATPSVGCAIPGRTPSTRGPLGRTRISTRVCCHPRMAMKARACFGSHVRALKRALPRADFVH